MEKKITEHLIDWVTYDKGPVIEVIVFDKALSKEELEKAQELLGDFDKQ